VEKRQVGHHLGRQFLGGDKGGVECGRLDLSMISTGPNPARKGFLIKTLLIASPSSSTGKGCVSELNIMPRTRNQEAAEKEVVSDHPEQTEAAPENPPAAEEPTTDKKNEDGDTAANAARERLQRFKALQARAVSRFCT
jgi:hypothetical protein